MLSLFRRNLIPNLILLCALCIGVNFYFFLNKPISIESTFAFSDLYAFDLLSSNHLITLIVSIILIIVQAYLLNEIVIRHKFSRALSSIPAACFILITAIISLTQLNLNLIVANLFCILSINSLFKLYKKYQPVTTIYNSGFFLGLASIFYPPYLIFLPAWFLCLYSLRNLKLNEGIQLSTGFLTPGFFLIIYAYSQEKLNTLLPEKFELLPEFTWPEDIRIVILASMIAILAVALISFSNEIKKKKKFDSIKKIEFLYWMIFVSALSLLFRQAGTLSHLMIISLPLSILLGIMLENRKNIVLKELVFLSLVGVIIFFQYGNGLIS